jgi:hypothetical protein
VALPSLLARVGGGAEIVGVEFDQPLLLRVVADQIFGEVAGRGLNILLGEFEPLAAQDDRSGEGGFMDLRVAKHSFAVPGSGELETLRWQRCKWFGLLRGRAGKRKDTTEKQQAEVSQVRFSRRGGFVDKTWPVENG